jgi:hypothetical protein
MSTPTGLNSTAHTGAGIGDPKAFNVPPKQPVNGLAAFANSPLGQEWTAANKLYGPSTMPNYTDAFQGALNSARGNIAQQLQGALGDIQNSQANAEQALGQYAPMVNHAWQAAQGQINNAATAGAGALAKYSVGPGAANADLAPEKIAMNLTHGNDLSDQALLNTGMQQQAQHERAMAQLAAQDRYGQVDQLQAQLQAQAAQSAQNEAYTRANNLQQFGLGLLNNAQQFKQQKELNSQAATTNSNPAPGAFGQAGFTQGQITTAMKSPQYGHFTSLISNAKAGTTEGNQLAGMILQATNGNPALQALLMNKYGPFFASAVMPGDQAPGGSIQDNPFYKAANAAANDNSTTGRVIQQPGRGLVQAIQDPSSLGRGVKRIGSWFNPFG